MNEEQRLIAEIATRLLTSELTQASKFLADLSGEKIDKILKAHVYSAWYIVKEAKRIGA